MVLADEGIRFENLVAVSLLKYLDAIEEYKGKKARLRTLRTKEKKEVDFVLVIDDQPSCMIEVKLSDSKISPTLRYFHKKYQIAAIQLVKNIQMERISDGIELRKAYSYLKNLKIED